MKDLTQSYGVRRPAEISARVAAMRARAFPVGLPSLEAAAVQLPAAAPVSRETSAPAAAEKRAPWIDKNPAQKELHHNAARLMWTASRAAGLSQKGALSLAGINALLGLALDSTPGLTPEEMGEVTAAIKAGRFSTDWELIELGGISAELVPAPVAAPAAPLAVAAPAAVPAPGRGSVVRPVRHSRPARHKRPASSAPRVSRSFLAARRATPDARRCACGARAVFFLCDGQGRELPALAGGFCASCRPCQAPDYVPTADETRAVPAALDLVESVSIDEEIAAINAREQWRDIVRAARFEVAELRAQRENLSGEARAEITAKIWALEDFEGVETQVDGGALPFIFGFDDLPPAYFEAQRAAQ